jgi:hypothetical protein
VNVVCISHMIYGAHRSPGAQLFMLNPECANPFMEFCWYNRSSRLSQGETVYMARSLTHAGVPLSRP